jgi:multiple sugar transport system permease protein/putative spermidine/putrescine transport system permease protein
MKPPRQPAGDARPWVSAGLFLALALTLLLPLALTVLWSLAETWRAPALWPQSWTTAHWTQARDDGDIIEATLRSLGIAVVVTLLTTAIALPTAWSLAKFPPRARRAVELFVLAPVIVPGLVVAVGMGQVFLMLGLAYTTLGVVLVQTVGTVPLMVRLLSATFETLPDELVLAARTLGATPLQVAWHVVLPLAVPGLLAGGLLSFVGSFEEFDKTFLIGAPVVETLPILLYHHLDPYSLQIPLAAVVALILLLPVMVVFVLSGRILRDDLLAAGMGKV